MLSLIQPLMLMPIALAFFAMWWIGPRLRHVLLFGLSFASYSAAAVIDILAWPNHVAAVLLCNFGYAVSVLVGAAGLLERAGARLPRWLAALFMAVSIAEILYFTFVQDRIIPRMAALSAVYGSLLLYVSWGLRRLRKGRPLDQLLFWVFWGFACSFLVRAALAIGALFFHWTAGANTALLLALQLSLASFMIGLALTILISALTDVVHKRQREARALARQREQALQLLSHDMRTPQASILALLHGREGQAIDPETARKIAALARRTLEHADAFVQLAKAESGRYQREVFDLSDALVEAADELWALASARNVTVRTEGVDQEHLVRGDRSLITRALANLIHNAVKHSPAGGTVTCRIANDRNAPIPSAEVSVRDMGPGLDAGAAARLFERFHRSGAQRQDSEGVGLGLALVQAVADRHQGGVAARPLPDQGSVFSLHLPLWTKP